ncbi:hypothetical protein FA13DRAFT_1742526 [Coprinellus micaceus]|uniref:Uncharacterized protein n=1 Tax=Coprinellus micaceus TaxID=71717 RepID=A0A4Y7SGW1_COPMI|nr:hypothetical protein FA13DRAFT_1742526 [Coprinellus micaceus]
MGAVIGIVLGVAIGIILLTLLIKQGVCKSEQGDARASSVRRVGLEVPQATMAATMAETLGTDV